MLKKVKKLSTAELINLVKEHLPLVLSRTTETATLSEGEIIHAAIDEGCREIVETLLNHGTNPSSKDRRDGYTPILRASRKGFREIVDLLLDRGCVSPNEKHLYEFTSLHVASAQGHIDCVKLLLDKNADPQKVDLKGDMPLHKAFFSGHREIVEVFLSKMPISHIKYPNGESLLIEAVRKRHSCEFMELLLERGEFDMNEKTADGLEQTALHIASAKGLWSEVNLLLIHGANPSTRDRAYKNSIAVAYNKRLESYLRDWPIMMAVLALQHLVVFHFLDCTTSQDLWQFLKN